MQITTVRETWQGARNFKLSGRYFRLLETVNPVDVQLGAGSQLYSKLEAVEAGAWCALAPDQRDFDLIRIVTSTNEAVKFVITDGEAGYDRLFTAFAQARTLTLPGNVAVGVAEVAVLAAASRSLVVFQADDANAGLIYLGPVGVTAANGPIVLRAGDLWREEIAASAPWRAIASVAAQNLRVMTAA